MKINNLMCFSFLLLLLLFPAFPHGENFLFIFIAFSKRNFPSNFNASLPMKLHKAQFHFFDDFLNGTK